MFGKLGQMMSLLGNLPKLQEDMKKFQESLGQITEEGEAGAGAVRVKVNGRMEVLRCELAETAFTGGDRELLEDLIKAATNQAITKIRQRVAEESGKMLGGMGLPPGVNIPGMM
jgi:DNA-binding YbaB/EbfC family protein